MDISGVNYCSRCMLKVNEEKICPHCGYDGSKAAFRKEYLEEGAFLNERYMLGAVIGSGGFGITYAAWDTLLETPVAIKEYYPVDFAERDVRDSDDVTPRERYETEYRLGLRRFIQESRVLAMFRQIPGIVNVSDCFEENNTFYFVMEYVRGVSLEKYAQTHVLEAKQLFSMMRSTVDALEAVHAQGILHRDITPKNLMVLEDGSVKLIDFGSARKIDREGTSIIVTEHYAPVEQYDNSREQGAWTDIYSLCATMYEVLTGVVPQESLSRKYKDELKTPRQMGVKLKKHQERALNAGLAVEPDKRTRSIAEFRSRLYNLPLPEEVRRRKAFKRKFFSVVGCIAAVAAAAAINFTTGLPLSRGLRYALHTDGFHVMGADLAITELNIPAKRLGIPVSCINAAAFSQNDELESVNLPGSIQCVEEMAFLGCDKLRMVTMEEGVEQIGAHAFSGCPQLHTANIPRSADEIDSTAFEGAWERFMIWGNSGSYAQSYAEECGIAFSDPAFYSYTLADGGAELYWDNIKATEAYYDKDKIYPGDGDALVSLYKEFTLPSYIDGYPVVSLRDDFYWPNAGKLALPYYLEYLPENYSELSGPALTEIDFGSSLKEIPYFMFAGLPLRSVQIPDTVESIGDLAFSYTNLTELDLPESLKSIGECAFEGTRLNEISLPEGLEYIGEAAFMDTPVYEVELPDSIKKVGAQAFENTSIQNVIMEIDLDVLDEGVFYECDELECVYIISKDGADGSSSGTIPAWSFAYSSIYFDASFLGSVKSIGAYCFAGSGVKDVSLPEGLLTIEEYAFADCNYLSEIIIPDSVTYIDPAAFDEHGIFTIVGSPDSYAEAYALEHGYNFSPVLGILREKCGFPEEDDIGQPFVRILRDEYGDALFDEYGVPRLEILEKAYAEHGYYDPALEDISGIDILMYECGELLVDAYDLENGASLARELAYRAEEGDVNAMYVLGLCYYYGADAQQSFAEAERWVSLAAENGHAAAQNRLEEWNK